MQKVSLKYIYFVWKPWLVKLCVMAPLCVIYKKGGRWGRDVAKRRWGRWLMIAIYMDFEYYTFMQIQLNDFDSDDVNDL